ncbi:MAG: glycoside hydrolase family 3 C-terminal domain-containing protein [Clostridia bacterium]|nr:glycoside hydrolase family 3 C-terminal domain-containing protein [Clostridia bacterium]
MRIIAKICHVVFSFLFAIMLTAYFITAENIGVISAALNQPTSERIDVSGEIQDTDYFKTNYTCLDDLIADGIALSEEIMAEGAVLLKNDNNCLPLNPETEGNISIFGVASVDPAYGGEGSAAASNPLDPVDVREGFENAGFAINDKLYGFYNKNKNAYVSTGYKINDASWNDVTSDDNVSASFEQYGDAAIVILKRIRGENGDLYYNNPSCDGEGGNYLALNDNEKSILRGLAELKGTTFNKIIVLLNAPNQIEAEFLFDPEYKIDAALWIGSVGVSGMSAVGKLISGEITPSGRLSDTFWMKHEYNPVMTNFGVKQYANVADYSSQFPTTSGNSYTGMNYTTYVMYQEGIYVGYRYAETRYYDVVSLRAGAGDFNYGEAIAYPFGYGLSYTSFEYNDFSVDYDSKTDSYTVNVTVKNTGDTAGKEVVQIYLQKPYTDYDVENHIEKSAVELVGYEKTETLEPGAEEQVKITVKGSQLASYDAYGIGSYYLDAGNYLFTAARDSHEAANNFLAENCGIGVGNANMVASFEKDADPISYSNGIVNLFDSGDILRYENASEKNNANYISRNDWVGTMPTGNLEIYLTQEMVNDILVQNGDSWIESGNTNYPTYGKDAGLQLIDMRADDEGNPIPSDSAYWDEFMDQLTYSEIAELITTGLRKTGLVESIGKPSTVEHNGPTGLTQKYGESVNGLAYIYGDPDSSKSPPYYPSLGILASTFNTDIAAKFGEMLGEDALWAGYSGFYGIGLNTHRSAYDGRNFEYYSEDPFLSGAQAAKVVAGLQSKGCNAYVKHIAGYEQQTCRVGLSVWSTEQAYREIYLEPFRMAIVDGGARNAMTSYTRIGVTLCPASRELCTDFLRGECGMDGFVVSDMWKGRYLDSQLVTCLMAGCDLPDSDLSADIYDKYAENYGDVAEQMRTAAKRILFATVNSNAMNGISAGTRIVKITPPWQQAVITGTVASGILFLLSTLGYAITGFSKRSF